MSLSIFSFDHYLPLMRHIQNSSAKKPLTYASWAKRLGYRSPRSLAMVIKGQRLPSLRLVSLIADRARLTHDEARYLELLVLKATNEKKGAATPHSVLSELNELKPNSFKRLGEQNYSMLTDWYCLAIRQLAMNGKVKDDPKALAKKLRLKTDPKAIQTAIHSMIRSGFLERTAAGYLKTSDAGSYMTATDIPSSAIRMYHREMLDRAKESLEEQSLLDRDFGGLTVRFDKSKIKIAKKRIGEVLTRLEREFYSPNAESVYQLNIQFFELTQDDS